MQKYDVQICLVSGQPTPNFIPAISEKFRPEEKVILIVSNEMKENANNLSNVLRHYHHINCQQEFLEDAYNIQEIQTQLEKLVSNLKEQNKTFLMNVTGGTKPMAIAAQAACFYSSQPYFYIHPDTNEMWFYTPDGKVIPEKVESKLKLRDYLEVHGYKIIKVEDSMVKPNEKVQYLLNLLAKDSQRFSESIVTLNWYASKAEREKSLTVEVTSYDQRFYELLSYFRDAGLLLFEGNKIRFLNENARFFANGGWLEDYVFSVASKLELQDCKKNLEVLNASGEKSRNETNAKNSGVLKQTQRGRNNEIDVACLARNRLFLIECKTRNFSNENGNKVGEDTLYKLDSLTALGGLNTNGMFISYRPLDEATKRRAKDLRIRVIEANQLYDLKNQLNTWIKQP